MVQPISPTTTQLYGIGLPTKRRAVAVSQSQVATLEFQILDSVGNPVDITELILPEGVQDDVTAKCKIREVISTKTADLFSIDCDVTDITTGMLSVALPAGVAKNAGVYNAEFGVLLDGDLILANKCFIWVDRGLFGSPRYPNAGPPTVDEVRLYIRDNAPEENRLLDDFEFDLAEICHATELAVRFWNEAQPPINIFFNTINYAVRDKWLQYIAGHMFNTAAHRFRRNHLPYQAGGIAVDDQNKFEQYLQIGMLLQQEYKDWVKNKKVQINCEMAITSTGSSYGASVYTALNSGV